MKTRKQLKIGSEILYRYFNKPEKKFYGDIRKGRVRYIFDHNGEKLFEVEHLIDGTNILVSVTLHRKEIKSILS
jgi:hypothetical protein